MTTRILAIDDEPDMEDLIRQKFRRRIRKEELSFVFATNGIEALKRLEEFPDINLVFSDINMPEMDGLSFLNKVKELNKPSLKTIMVSAYGDMDNIRTAMNRGAFDFVMKPINFDDLEITMEKTLEQIESVKNALEDRDKLVAIQQDLNVARDIQKSILPKKFPAFPERLDFDLFANMEAAKEVGGDFYDFFLLDDDHLGMIIADVSGKGISAALFMAVSRTMLKANSLIGIPVNESLNRTNDLLCVGNVNSMFVTVFYGVLNTKTGDLEYANAGHNPPYIIRNDGTVEILEGTGEIVLAALEGFEYSMRTNSLTKGESIYMFTDGITEAMNPQNELFSEERLVKVLSEVSTEPPKNIVQKVEEEVKKFADGAAQSDDITSLVVKYIGSE